MTLPAVKELRALYPDAEIAYLGGLECERELLGLTGLVDQVYIYDVKNHKSMELLKLVIQLRKEKFDLGLSLGMASARGLDVALLRMVGCKKIVSRANENALYKKYCQVAMHGVKHRTYMALECTKALGGKGKLESVGFQIPDDEKDLLVKKYSIEKDRKIVGLVLGSGDFFYRKGSKKILYNTKRWGYVNFQTLCEDLIAEGYQVILFGGPKEKKELQAENILFPSECVDVVGKTTLTETIALLGECTIVVGADTGMMHCAAVQGVDTLTLFGPTDPNVSGPIGKDAHWIISESDCKFCYHECREKGYECQAPCMEEMKEESVLAHIIKLTETRSCI